jgi:membrane protease YdiL (CAAX protease family)
MSSLTTSHDREHSTGRLQEAARGHPVRAFFVLTFALTWTYELVVFGLLDLEFIPWSIPGTFGPAIAAVLVTRTVDGTEGLREFRRRLVLWRVDARWYLFALVVLPAVVAAGYVFMPDPKQNVDDGALVIAATYVSSLLILTLMGGGQEEPGWRGFALPRMQEHHGPLKASVLLGVLWGVWHLPLFVFVPDYDNADPGFVQTATMFIVFAGCFTIALSVIFTWLVNHARGSILLAMLAHGSVNAATNFAPETALPLMVSFMAMGVLALVIALATHGRLGYTGRWSSEPRARERGTGRPRLSAAS